MAGQVTAGDAPFELPSRLERVRLSALEMMLPGRSRCRGQQLVKAASVLTLVLVVMLAIFAVVQDVDADASIGRGAADINSDNVQEAYPKRLHQNARASHKMLGAPAVYAEAVVEEQDMPFKASADDYGGHSGKSANHLTTPGELVSAVSWMSFGTQSSKLAAELRDTVWYR